MSRRDEDVRMRCLKMRAYGARRLDEMKWKAIVEKAQEYQEQQVREMSRSYIEATRFEPSSYRFRPIVLGPGQVPVDMQMILDLELRMTEIGMLVAELEEMGAREALDEGYRARIRHTIDTAVKAIEKRCKEDRRAHLRVVDGGGE